MNGSKPVLRLTAAPQRRISALTALAAATLLAFFHAPDALTRGSVSTANVGDSFRRGFVAYWNSGSRDFPARLENTVAFWFRFHLVKAGVSALLLAVAVALGVVLWRHFRQRTGGRSARLPLGLSCVLAGMLALFALVALVANLQGAAAPFASLFPMLTSGGADGELAAALAQVRQEVAVHPSRRHSPALTVMVGDFAVHHAVLAAMAAPIAFALAGTSVMLWRRPRTSPGTGSKRAAKPGAAVSSLLAAVVLVIAVANAVNAVNSPRALAHFFAGGW
ncbi:tat (twin-arginine translocation) pathway signal sequence [Streptomyces sp. NPDC052701]|uniref:tat (twin-arginine translocation) pathway signal sequence n=1 Tax=Streptomyces sp. NPDC052701 TaxID=3155533 RepID=UPI0034444E73